MTVLKKIEKKRNFTSGKDKAVTGSSVCGSKDGKSYTVRGASKAGSFMDGVKIVSNRDRDGLIKLAKR